MKGDFTRDTFDPANHFSRVLMQQGRVQLDADWNEQAAILLHYMRTLAADLIGPYGGPHDSFLFKAMKNTDEDFLIGTGHYYVDGLLVENEGDTPYSELKYFSPPDEEQPLIKRIGINLVYLDVWERHLTYLELEDAADSVISIREAALNGPDTATRTKVVWQVKLFHEKQGALPTLENLNVRWPELVQENWQPSNRGKLKACAIKPAMSADDPCIIAPESRYRGTQNQLYRVEIYLDGGAGVATFKWSRDNGSVIFPIRDMTATSITLESLGRDTQQSLQAGDWVEIVDDDYTLQNRAEPLLQREVIDYEASLVTLTNSSSSLVKHDMHKHPLLRRWDQRSSDVSNPTRDGIKIVEGENDQTWIELEDGVQIQFQRNGSYRTGDYWLIPARKATGNVEWPGPVGDPQPRPPHGVEHHYAPLFRISVGSGKVTLDMDLRRTIESLAK